MELALLGWALGWPLLFLGIHGHPGTAGAFVLSKALFLVVSILCGLLVGAQFPLANRIYLQGRTSASKTAGRLYASDLLGGWLGGMAGAVVLLPVLGLIGTSITVGLLKLTSFAVVATAPAGRAEGGTV
jgi:spermidine synthase